MRMITDQARRIYDGIQEDVATLLARAQNARTESERENLRREVARLVSRQNTVLGIRNNYQSNIYNSPIFREASERALRMAYNGNTREAQRLMRVAMGRLYSRREYMRRNS